MAGLCFQGARPILVALPCAEQTGMTGKEMICQVHRCGKEKDIVVPGKPRHSECLNFLKYRSPTEGVGGTMV